MLYAGIHCFHNVIVPFATMEGHQGIQVGRDASVCIINLDAHLFNTALYFSGFFTVTALHQPDEHLVARLQFGKPAIEP